MGFLCLIAAMSGLLSVAGQIAYVDTGAGDGGAVFVLDLERGETLQVGPGREDGAPRWSPDGAWLLFETAGRDGGRGTWLVRHDGRGGRLHGGDGVWDTAPAWSTDGRRIVFCRAAARGAASTLVVADLESGAETIWGGSQPGLLAPRWLPHTKLLLHLVPDQVLDAPGVNMGRLLTEARMTREELGAQTLPEALIAVQALPGMPGRGPWLGTRIVLVTHSEVLPIMPLADPARAEIGAAVWGVTPDWTDAEIVATPGGGFGAYRFEDPGDTESFAFESDEGGDREVFVMGRRGIVNVTNHRAADWNPVWSPEGKLLAFESFRGGNRGVYTVFTDTAYVRHVAGGREFACWSPAWSPDGRYLVYVSDESGAAELHAAEIEDADRRALTAAGGGKEAPAWRPRTR
ncbi:MAG: PD40 domain-containing protein [Candidatus Hydrogenedentes bacterium]|nr:PD40 domain-containing protein [Candidatus Hydrogenedentota bacterium]